MLKRLAHKWHAFRRSRHAAAASAAMRRWWPQPEGAPPGGEPAAPWPEVVRQVRRHGWLAPAGRWALERQAPDVAMRLAEQCVAAGIDAATLREACRIAFDTARIPEALTWAQTLESLAPTTPAEAPLLASIHERAGVLGRLARPAAARPMFEPVPRRVLAMLAYSLPHTSNGYATRSHGLLTAVRDSGWDVRPHTRPGYAVDAGATEPHPPAIRHDEVDGLHYGRLPRASRKNLGHMAYLHAAADEIGGLIREIRPSVVHAASNYMTALPACMAAREAGLPFVYEVRGFWDVTRISSDPSFAGTSACLYLRMFEREVLRHADALVTLTGPMREELVRRGVDRERILVAPNAISARRLDPRPRDEALASVLELPAGVPVIGFIGSFVDYEGLDDLLVACAQLRRQGRDFRLLLVGDGLALPQVQRLVDELGLRAIARLPGRVDHAEVPRYYSLVTACPFPRKPWPVCELVSPLKPYEAMALAKPVVVSSVAALSEMVADGVTGRVFAKGDPAALAGVLGELLEDPTGAEELGRQARRWVAQHRSWPSSAAVVTQAYDLAARSSRRVFPPDQG